MRGGTELPTFDNEHILRRHHMLGTSVPVLTCQKAGHGVIRDQDIVGPGSKERKKGPKWEIISKVPDNVHVMSYT